tara:strand:+ start:2773 stop:2913 length:141 start_codon:yes stop_codon:yes gene_type:complete
MAFAEYPGIELTVRNPICDWVLKKGFLFAPRVSKGVNTTLVFGCCL